MSALGFLPSGLCTAFVLCDQLLSDFKWSHISAFFSRWSCYWCRDWLRFARPSQFGTPVQEISNHLSVFASDFRFLVIGVGIGFALLAHPCLVILCKKSATTWRCLHLIFVSYLLVSELSAAIKRKSGATFVVPDFLRRERDSNPRYLSVRRFSRPVQSTTLPPLHELFFNKNVVSSCLMVQRYIKKIYRARKMEKKLNIL